MGSAVSVMAPVWGRAAWLRMSSSGENLSDHDLFPADPTRNEPYRQRLRGGGLPAGSHLRASTTARLRVRLAAPGGRRMALRPGQHYPRAELVAAGSTRDPGLVHLGPHQANPPRLPALPAHRGSCGSCPIPSSGPWCEPCPMTIRSGPCCATCSTSTNNAPAPSSRPPRRSYGSCSPCSCRDPSPTVTVHRCPPISTRCWSSSAPPGPHRRVLKTTTSVQDPPYIAPHHPQQHN